MVYLKHRKFNKNHFPNMGAVLSFLKEWLADATAKIAVIGIPGCGITTIQDKLHTTDNVLAIPKHEKFHIESIEEKEGVLLLWDLGDEQSILSFWDDFFNDVAGIIYVIDSSSQKKFEESKEKLIKFLQRKEIPRRPLLIYLNKQDLPNSVSKDEALKELGFLKDQEIDFTLQPSSSLTGKGLKEGIRWLVPKII